MEGTALEAPGTARPAALGTRTRITCFRRRRETCAQRKRISGPVFGQIKRGLGCVQLLPNGINEIRGGVALGLCGLESQETPVSRMKEEDWSKWDRAQTVP